MESRGFETDPDKGLKQLQDPVPSSETAFQVTEALPSSNPPSNAGKPFLSNGLQKSPAVQTPPTADGTDLELVPHLEVTPAEDKNAACKPSNGLIAEPDQGAQEEGLDQDTPQPTGNGPSSAARPRSIKTKEQKEALEAAFLLKQYPEEDVRRTLGERIGLTEQQVQVWFSHKRRKDKKDQEEAVALQIIEQRHAQEQQATGAGGASAVAAIGPEVAASRPPPAAQQNGSAQAAPQGQGQEPELAVNAPTSDKELTTTKAPNTVPAAIAAGHSKPGLVTAAALPKVATAPQQPIPQPQNPAATAQEAIKAILQERPKQLAARSLAPPPVPLPIAQPEDPQPIESAIARLAKMLKAQPSPEELSAEEHAEIPELVEAVKQSMVVPFRVDGPPLVYEFDEWPQIDDDGKYLDDQPPQKRKRVDGDDEEAARKKRPTAGAKGSAKNEADRLDRERRRNEDKVERENKRKELARTKEEVRLRALQEREEKKLQALAEKERKAQERKELLVERRKEKEVLKALQAQEKQATRLRQRDANTGPKDDLDLEWEALLNQQQAEGYSSGTEEAAPRGHAPPVRPEFPPPHLKFQRWLPSELEGTLGSDLLFVWNFLHSFGYLLDLPKLRVHHLLQALLDGEKSRLLGEIHIGMLRIVQADMEEAHATGAMQSGSAINFLDKAIVSCATRLEEAWAWGFDIDAWRAHIGPLTWPEVLRQQAIVWGLGPKRPKPKKEVKPKMGTDGEDVYSDETGSLKLKLPVRFGIGTVKAAAWAVLAESGPEGLSIGEIARRIQQSGLRDLRTSKTPEASVAGALSRDVIFARPAPATYALQAIVTHHSLLDRKGSPPVKKEAVDKTEAGKKEDGETPEHGKEGSGEGETKKSEDRSNEEEEDEDGDSSGDEDEEDDQAFGKATGEAWVQTLLTKDYRDLDTAERATVLAALTHLTLDGPTLRNTLEARHEESGRVRKQMWEEARAEKRRKQEEAAAKAKLAAEEAQKVLEGLKAREGSTAPSEAPNGGPPGSAAATPAPEGGDERRGSTTPKPTPEADVPSTKTEPNAEVAEESSAQPETVVKAEDEERTRPTETSAEPDGSAGKSAERQSSERPVFEPGTTKREEAEEEKAATAAAAKEQQLQRAETILKAEEANAIRGEPLGLDRRYNKYWRFVDTEDCTGDPLAGTLVMECHEDGSFRYLGHEDGVEALIESLDKRGAREGPLNNNLLRYREALGTSGQPFCMPAPKAEEEEDRLYEEQLAWVKTAPLVAARKAKGRHPNPMDDDPCIERLRRDLLLVEKALPRTALTPEWDSASWKEGVRACSGASDFRVSLAALESAVQVEYLSPYFYKDPLLVRGAWLPTGQEVASALLGANNEVQRLADEPAESPETGEGSSPLGWLPRTLAAVALRLYSLDANLVYTEGGQPGREVLSAYNYTQRPHALPKGSTQVDGESSACNIRSLSGQAVALGGRALPILLPSFPVALATAQRQPFTLEWNRVKKEIADERAGILPPPIIPRVAALQAAEKPGKKQRRTSAKGKAAGKGKSGKSKAKAKQSALREEFDRQSEEEEAAERAAFSTPGFSDDDSDDFLPRGRKRKAEEEEEISD